MSERSAEHGSLDDEIKALRTGNEDGNIKTKTKHDKDKRMKWQSYQESRYVENNLNN